jgi:hypothetical protein
MAEGATVEESAMLVNRVTGEEREVDVVLRSEAGGYTLTVGIEASSIERRASVEWVERMIGKHADLPTDKLVLVSNSGFTKSARALADAKGVTTISPEDLEADEVVKRLRSIWPKLLSLVPESAKLYVQRPGETGTVWFEAFPDHLIFLEDGTEVGTLIEVASRVYDANFPEIIEQIGLAQIAEDTLAFFLFRVGPGWRISVDETETRLFVRHEEEGKIEYHPIEALELRGKAEIKVSEIELSYGRLGDVTYAYGEGSVGGRDALVVGTEDEDGGGLMTIRFRPEGKKKKAR